MSPRVRSACFGVLSALIVLFALHGAGIARTTDTDGHRTRHAAPPSAALKAAPVILAAEPEEPGIAADLGAPSRVPFFSTVPPRATSVRPGVRPHDRTWSWRPRSQTAGERTERAGDPPSA